MNHQTQRTRPLAPDEMRRENRSERQARQLREDLRQIDKILQEFGPQRALARLREVAVRRQPAKGMQMQPPACIRVYERFLQDLLLRRQLEHQDREREQFHNAKQTAGGTGT